MSHPDHEPHDDTAATEPALHALASRLDAHGAAFAAERPGLADRVHAASVRELGGRAPLARIGWWAWPVAAAAAAAVAIVVWLPDSRPVSHPHAMDLVSAAARAGDLPGSGRSERLIVALTDPAAAVAAGEPAADGASAVAIMRARDVDDFSVELDELLSVGGRR